MARCPFATMLLLPESATQPRIVARAVVLHSAAGKGSLYKFFRDSSSLESHFWVGERGQIEQYIDTGHRADANRNANGFAISIETESTVAATERWNPTQAAAIVRLVTWICDEHHIPKRKIPTWDGSGIGWHIQFGSPGPWTPVSKSCPGPARVKQVPEIIAAVAGHPTNPAPTPPTDTEEPIMATQADKDAIRTIVREELKPVTIQLQNLISDLLLPDEVAEKGVIADRLVRSLTKIEANTTKPKG
jgi:hypothetical protein